MEEDNALRRLGWGTLPAPHYLAISIEVGEPPLLQYDLYPVVDRLGAVDTVEPAVQLGLVEAVDIVESAGPFGLVEADRNVASSGRSHVGFLVESPAEVAGSVGALAEEGPHNGQEKTQPDQTTDFQMMLARVLGIAEILVLGGFVALVGAVQARAQNLPRAAVSTADLQGHPGLGGNLAQRAG